MPKREDFDTDAAWYSWLGDKRNNPFKMGDHVRCIKIVEGRNIYVGDMAVCGPHNAKLIGLGKSLSSTNETNLCGVIVPADHFEKIA